MSIKTVCISGGLDPLHVGHIRYITEAAAYGKLVVILNSDAWLKRKKGYIFMPWAERAEIIQQIKGVHCVVTVDDSDGTVCKALEEIKPDYFMKGGDRTEENTPELALCVKLGIRTLFNVGGGKVQSSSSLVRQANNNHYCSGEVGWGKFTPYNDAMKHFSSHPPISEEKLRRFNLNFVDCSTDFVLSFVKTFEEKGKKIWPNCELLGLIDISHNEVYAKLRNIETKEAFITKVGSDG